jgi:transcriptional antiterminator
MYISLFENSEKRSKMIVHTIDKARNEMKTDDSKKSSPSTPIHIKLNTIEDAQLAYLADKLGVSKSWIIQECVRKSIETYETLLKED